MNGFLDASRDELLWLEIFFREYFKKSQKIKTIFGRVSKVQEVKHKTLVSVATIFLWCSWTTELKCYEKTAEHLPVIQAA